MPICPQGHHTLERDYCEVCGCPIDIENQPTGVVASAVTPASTVEEKNCPECGAMNPEDALFCEGCGFDYTTGAKPRTREEAMSMLDLDTPVSPIAPSAPTKTTSDTAISMPETVVPEPDFAVPESPAPVADIDSEVSEPSASAIEDFTHVAEVWIDPAWYTEQQSSDPMPSPGLPMVYPLRGRRTQLVGRASKSRGIAPDVDCGVDTGCSRRQSQLSTDGYRWWVEDLDSANGTYVAPSSGPLPHAPISGRTEVGSTDRIYVGGWTRIVIRKATPDELTVLKGD